MEAVRAARRAGGRDEEHAEDVAEGGAEDGGSA